MESYKEKYQKKKSSGTPLAITTRIINWKEPGEHLIGRLHDIRDFVGEKIKTKVNQYIIETDEGLFSCILGSATDKQIVDQVEIDDNIAITYDGQIDLDGGKRCNLFTIEKF